MYLFLNVFFAILFFGYFIFSERIENFIYKVVIYSNKKLDEFIERRWKETLKDEEESDDGRY